MFNELASIIPVKGSLNIILTKTQDNQLVLSILPKFPEEEDVKSQIALTPLTISGNIEELTEGFGETIKNYRPSVRKFQTNLLEVKASIEKEAQKLKAKTEKKSNTSGTTSTTEAPKPKPANGLLGCLKDEAKENLEQEIQ